MKQVTTKWLIVGIMVLAITGLLIFKAINKKKQDVKVEPNQVTKVIEPAPLEVGLESNDDTETTPGAGARLSTRLGPGTLASVNHRQITEKELEERFQSLADEYKSAYKNNKEGLLDQLIIEEVLYQEAERRGYTEKSSGNLSPENKMMGIRKLIMAVTEKVSATDRETLEFYNTHPAEVQGASYDEIKEEIKKYLIGQKQNEMVDKLIADLKRKARISRSQEWLTKQAALKPENPLIKALKSGIPTVLDLGSGTCIPCKMMKPIFEELEKEYQGKANIILLEINDYRDLANQYQVRVIPTQIFFDKQGNQTWRHEGFLAKEEIVKRLKEMGAN